MGLIEQGEGVPAGVRHVLEVNSEVFHVRFHNMFENSQKAGGLAEQMYQTPRLEDLLLKAEAVAERLNDEFIGSEHVLIGLTH